MRRLIFDVPRWHAFLHREARGIDSATPWDDPRRQFEDELFDRLYAGDGVQLDDSEKHPTFASWASHLHQTLAQHAAFQRTADQCRDDVTASATATQALLDELKPPAPDQAERGAGFSQRVIATACDRAAQAVDEVREIAEGLRAVRFGRSAPAGRATSAATPSSSVAGLRQLAARVRTDDRLKRIALLAGRFKRIALAKQRQKVRSGADELSDIELGADLSRLLPTELLRFTSPRQRLGLLRDLSERRCLQYHLSGADSLGKGPLVVALDKSGSMQGDRDLWATAVSLALLEVAQRQRRMFVLLAFDGAVKFEALVHPSETLPEDGLLIQCAGGTDISVALTRALEIIRTHPGAIRKADVVLITDGESDTGSSPAVRHAATELGVTVLGVGIGVGADVLRPWCDESHSVSAVDSMDDATASTVFTL